MVLGRMEKNTVKAERYPERRVYKLLIWLLKIIPMLLAITTIAGTLCSFFGVNPSVFSFIGSISLFPLLFLYLASYAFRFCIYHRMFLHYIVANNALVYADYFWKIPVEDTTLLMVHLILIGIFLFLVLFFYRREKCCRR